MSSPVGHGRRNRYGPPCLFTCQDTPNGSILLSVRSESGQVNPVTGRRVVDASLYSVEFKPRGTGRRLVGLITLMSLGATAYLGWQAYEERTSVAIGIAGT